MPIKRINSTGRKRILREDAKFVVRSTPDGTHTFDANINLSDYDLPPEAPVIVEAYRQTTIMRFQHGTVASPRPAQATSRKLVEFLSPDSLQFRVKVISAGEPLGLLLAEGDRIPVSDYEEHPDNRIPLLPTVPADLGHEAWRVDFSGSSGPLLLINIHLGDWRTVAALPAFRSLVYPAAMRQVLWHIHKIYEAEDVDDPENWCSHWFQFASALPGVGERPSGDDEDSDWEEWITTAVESFTSQHQMLNQLTAFLSREVTV
jgi:hypothetical protein